MAQPTTPQPKRPTRRRDRELASLHAGGFDMSCILREGYLKVRCSRCDATFINGIPCHETGCPNTVYECKADLRIQP